MPESRTFARVILAAVAAISCTGPFHPHLKVSERAESTVMSVYPVTPLCRSNAYVLRNSRLLCISNRFPLILPIQPFSMTSVTSVVLVSLELDPGSTGCDVGGRQSVMQSVTQYGQFRDSSPLKLHFGLWEETQRTCRLTHTELRKVLNQ